MWPHYYDQIRRFRISYDRYLLSSAGEGVYELDLALPKLGIYSLQLSVPSKGVNLDQAAPLVIQVGK